ncbi:hypothetical protein BpHYR1_044295 [Brachionus plicatilis]|uniref:Uncharacterized protein n=1 Tax=Brachionus plicatilis TaxID=10195 RepID=A0A3M7PD68_BRAPC|nr:hypothetical protein BpHYR1_044295 [Brachionus plicatilis]
MKISIKNIVLNVSRNHTDTGIIAFNGFKEMAPAISNIVTASQSNVLILSEIQAIKNEMRTFKEDNQLTIN